MSASDRFQAGPDDQGRRVDRIIRRLYPGLPLSMLYRMFRTGSIRISGKMVKGADLIQAGDEIMVKRPHRLDVMLPPAGKETLPSPAKNKRYSQLFESMILASTPDLVIINKPKGLLTHGPDGLDEIVTAYFSGRLSTSLSFRPAPLHRLDRNTSGVLAVSASIVGARVFSAAMKAGLIGKEYLALLDGRLETELHMKDRLLRNGKDMTSGVVEDGDGAVAETWLLPLAASARHTLVAVRISTGLTHQIRVQCASHGFPLSGDTKYRGRPLQDGYLLHCARLEFPVNFGADVPETVMAPVSSAFISVLEGIFDPVSLDSEAFQRYF